MVERELQNGLDTLEMDDEGNAHPDKVVKAYRRSAAGIDQPLPSDVRTPATLISTLNYLVNDILPQYPLDKCHAFVRDRTRSIRQDFTLQNIRDLSAIQAHERIARFHILCLHELCEYDESKFSEQQETEQLRKVLISLMEFYDDLREEGIETENEPEFRAYHLISHIKDQDVARQVMTLPIHVFRHPYVTRALEFFGLSQRNNEIMETSSRRNKPSNIEAGQNFYSQFFKLIADAGTPFLMACMLECHFADIRKGALKAMNVSYMIKAGGVIAENVRQTLAYDTVQQLLQEVNLYGIVIDLSLGEPTICFGQKHYRTKIPIFKEPLSNPSQKRSMLLVEPKKAGRSFGEIIDGNNPYATPLPNQNVFARQSSLITSAPGGSVFDSPPKPTFDNGIQGFGLQSSVMNTGFSMGNEERLSEKETAKIEAERKEKQLQLDLVKSRAEAVAAAAALERKKMEALMAKKQEEAKRLKLEQEKLIEQKQLEVNKRILEQQKQARLIEQERLRKEKEVQEALRKEQIRQEIQKKKMAEMHLNVIKSQVCTRVIDEMLEFIIKEQVCKAVSKAKNVRKVIKKRTLPWVLRARQRINDRNKCALEQKHMWHYQQCTSEGLIKYSSLHSTVGAIKEKVKYCLQAEKNILLHLDNPLNNNQDSIWKPEDFSKLIYPIVKSKQTTENNSSQKQTWQLLISVPDNDVDSNLWFQRKFGLDDTFLRKVNSYPQCDVISRFITSSSELPSKLVSETGAVIFSLPESRIDKSPEELSKYWTEQKQRLNKLIGDLQFYKPGIQIPVLFTYFPDSTPTEEALNNIPIYLGLSSNVAINDYHFLIMNPLTIPQRMKEEVCWLADSFVTY
ncbi:unnamed protein product [Mucor hiemalis]